MMSKLQGTMFVNSEIITLQTQINKLYEAIRLGNMVYLKNFLDDIECQNIYLWKIVLAEFLAANNGIMPTTNRALQYEDYVALANKYIGILQSELYDLQNNIAPFSYRAVNTIYSDFPHFQRIDTLYRENGKKLTVADVLSVIGYAKKVIDVSDAKMNKKLSMGIDLALMSLNTIDLALNNKKQDKPLNKALHLVNDALSFVLNTAIEDERLGKYVDVSSTTIDLTIDFLVKE